MNKKIFLIFHGRLPSEKAASLFAAKEAESFAMLNQDISIIIPSRRGGMSDNLVDFYGLKKDIGVIKLWSVDLFNTVLSGLAFYISIITFIFSLVFYCIRNIKRQDLIITNDISVLLVLSFFHKNILYEMHDFPEKNFFLYSFALKRTRHILIHNKWKRERAIELIPSISSKILCIPNAVTIEDFDIANDTAEARSELGLPQDKILILYTGHLYGWKGVDTLASCSQFLSDDFLLVFVGGTDKDLKEFKSKFGHDRKIAILGQMPYKKIPKFLKAAQVLVIPNTAKEKIAKYYTSPMKLFEYMASKRPIVASDLPSIRDVADEKCFWFFSPDNPLSCAERIREAIEKHQESADKTKNAFEEVKKYSWINRAKTILDFTSF